MHLASTSDIVKHLGVCHWLIDTPIADHVCITRMVKINCVFPTVLFHYESLYEYLSLIIVTDNKCCQIVLRINIITNSLKECNISKFFFPFLKLNVLLEWRFYPYSIKAGSKGSIWVELFPYLKRKATILNDSSMNKLYSPLMFTSFNKHCSTNKKSLMNLNSTNDEFHKYKGLEMIEHVWQSNTKCDFRKICIHFYLFYLFHMYWPVGYPRP